jgi:dihydrofolate reductase
MRKLIVWNLMSLDGFFETPDKKLDWCVIDEEFFAMARELLGSVGAILFGRATYEHMAAYWPSAAKDEIADKMNGLPKIVFSRTLKKAVWNNSRLVKGDAGAEVSKLKKQSGKDMVILGSAMLANSLLQAGLIDEYRVVLNPVLIGAGNPLFKGIRERLRLKLQNTKLLKSGVVVLYCQKA